MEKNQSIQQEKLELKEDCPQYFERDVSNNVNTQNMAS
jgi:nuclear transcription Y subunit beta